MKNDSAYSAHFSIRDLGISDHFLIDGTLNIPKPRPVKKTISYRKLKDINIESLNSDISNAFNIVDDPTTATLSYNETMEKLLEKHAPVLTKEFTARPNTKWYNANIRKAKVVRRRLERKKNKSNLQCDIDAYRAQAKLVNYLISEAKTDFNKTEVLKSKGDIKKLFHTCKRIMNWVPDTEYPCDVSPKQLPDHFSDFFL